VICSCLVPAASSPALDALVAAVERGVGRAAFRRERIGDGDAAAMTERVLGGEALVIAAPVVLCGLPGDLKGFLDSWLGLHPQGRLVPRTGRMRGGYVATYAPDDPGPGEVFHRQVRGIYSFLGISYLGCARGFVPPGGEAPGTLLAIAGRLGVVLAKGEGFAGFPEEYLSGIARFNAGEFWEAHEAWEEIWIAEGGELRLFYQGLIQVAAALHHHGNRNWQGMHKLMRDGTDKLARFLPHAMGLDLDAFLAALAPWRELAEARCGRPGVVTRLPGEPPRIVLDAAYPG